MSGIYFDKGSLDALIEHHIGVINRYGFERNEVFSVVVLECKDLLLGSISGAFKKILRESDAIINDGEYYFLILPSTNKDGALTLVNSILEYLGVVIRFKVLSYPTDGFNGTELIERVKKFRG